MPTNLTVKDFNNLFRTNGKLQRRAPLPCSPSFHLYSPTPLVTHACTILPHEELKKKNTFLEHSLSTHKSREGES